MIVTLGAVDFGSKLFTESGCSNSITSNGSECLRKAVIYYLL